jgi:glycosyltransferase involved in cell wall biosynthesis
MKISTKKNNSGGLYVLGSLYPYVTGGMEIFNYYFLNYRLNKSSDDIYYLGENRTDNTNGYFVPIKRRWPIRLIYPIQFFIAVFKLRSYLDYAYLCYAEQSWIIPYFHSLTLRFFKIPYIITIHWGKEPAWKFRYPFIYYFRHAHAVIGVSEPICTSFKKVIPDQDFIYIPPIIPFQDATGEKSLLKKNLGYSDKDKILLFVGSLKPMKNPDKIIEAFRIIGQPFLISNDIRLIFAGNGEMENELRKRVEKYELGEFIRFVGLVSREIIPVYYKASDFYVISSDYEGTSLSLMEAMFNKLAIIASDAPGINRMLRHEQNALLYETKNIEQLAETFKRVFTDPSLAITLSERVYEDYKSQYSYPSMIEKYETLFSAI